MTIRVAHVLDDLAVASGGTVRACVDLCEALERETSCRPTIIAQNREAPEVAVAKEIVVHRLHSNGGLSGLWRWSKAFEELLPASGIDVVHVNGLWSPFLHGATQAANRLGLSLVVSPHGMLEPWSLKQKRLKKGLALRFYQWADLRRADLVHATAASEEQNLRKLGLEHTFVLPNGVSDRSVARRSFRDPGMQALFLSRIHPKKGIENLLRAWSEVRPERWRLKIVGPGEQRYLDRLGVLRDKLGLEGIVTFEAPANGPEKWSYYESSDLFVLPTFSENFGIVIAEALQSGVPVITTHEAPWGSLVSHRCGWWIPAELSPLKDAIREATSLDREDLIEMGERGQRLIESQFLWRGIACRMNEAYEQLLNAERVDP